MMGVLLLCDLTFQSRPRCNIPSARSKCRPWCHGPGKSLSHRRIGPGRCGMGYLISIRGVFLYCSTMTWWGVNLFVMICALQFYKTVLDLFLEAVNMPASCNLSETGANSPLSVKATCACFDRPWVFPRSSTWQLYRNDGFIWFS